MHRDFLTQALEEYLPQAQLPRLDDDTTNREANARPLTLILTGSTGSLGSCVVAALRRLPPSRLRRVYCLNRQDDAQQKQKDSFLERGLPPLTDPRFVFLKADLAAPNLGMSPKSHADLQTATLILHIAWTVNFGLPGSAFKHHLTGLKNLATFAHASPNRPPLLFVSSLGIAYASDMPHVPERVFHRDEVDLHDGYCQSKYVAERMIEAYAESSGLMAGILRVGQLCGPVSGSGVWPQREWFPTLIRASNHMGVMPDSLGKHDDVDWIPVDVSAVMITEIVEHCAKHAWRGSHHQPLVDAARPAPIVFNIANPSTTPYRSLVASMGCVAPATVSGEQWVEMLRERARVDRKTPGAKLLGLYQSIFEGNKPAIQTVTTNTRLASRTGRHLRAVNGQWVRGWMSQWGYRRPRWMEARL